VRSVLGLGEWEMGGGDECGEKGQAPHPFIVSEGERGDQAAAVLHHNGMKAAVSEGNQSGDVVGSDEEYVLRPLRERRQHREAACAHARQWRRQSAWGRRRGRREKGRVGRPKATGPAGRWADAGEREGGPRLDRKAGWAGWPLGRLGRK
jgi:hypothetical protein